MTKVKKYSWFDRSFSVGLPLGMLPFYLERLDGTLSRLEKRVSGIPDEILSEKFEGKWSVKQNIGHLAEIDIISIKRVDEMIAGISPMSPAVFEPKDYSTQPLSAVLGLLRDTRTRSLDHYEHLSSDDLQKQALHPRLKVMMTPVDLAFFDAEHDDHHLVRIKEIITQHYPNKPTY